MPGAPRTSRWASLTPRVTQPQALSRGPHVGERGRRAAAPATWPRWVWTDRRTCLACGARATGCSRRTAGSRRDPGGFTVVTDARLMQGRGESPPDAGVLWGHREPPHQGCPRCPPCGWLRRADTSRSGPACRETRVDPVYAGSIRVYLRLRNADSVHGSEFTPMAGLPRRPQADPEGRSRPR